jgi:hypothetical protein
MSLVGWALLFWPKKIRDFHEHLPSGLSPIWTPPPLGVRIAGFLMLCWIGYLIATD